MQRTQGITVVAVLVALGCAATAFAGPPLTQDQALQLLARPGSWVEVDGAIQPDGTLLGKDIEIVAPSDTANQEEPAIYGGVENLNRAKSTMKVLGYVVTWDEKTTFKDENKRKILSSKVEEGSGVKVQGKLQPNGSYLASKFRLHPVEKTKDGKPKFKQKVFGPVTVLDARSGKLRVLNTIVTLRPDATFAEATPSTTAP
jgi:hypothetical protein